MDTSINQSFISMLFEIFISGCTVGGQTYRVGESYTAEDGCNTWCVMFLALSFLSLLLDLQLPGFPISLVSVPEMDPSVLPLPVHQVSN